MNRLTKRNRPWAILTGFSLLLATVAHLDAEGSTKPPAATGKLDEFEGTVKQVNPDERTITVKNFWSSRTFNLAGNCRVSFAEESGGGLEALQSGHRVTVQFANHDGVRIAHAILQENLEYTGHIAALNPTNRTLRVKSRVLDRVFTAAPDCRVVFRDGQARNFSELKIGHRVTINYLTPDDAHLARSIAQRSLEYSGRVEALDARTDTVKAGGLVAGRTFRLGDGCQIVIAGETGGDLKNLRIGDRVIFNYENIDGVFVANRLELVADSEEPAIERLTSRKTRSP